MDDDVHATPVLDITDVRRLAAAGGLDLAADRAEALLPFVQGILEADAALAALDLGTLPAVGLPWAPFADAPEEEHTHGG